MPVPDHIISVSAFLCEKILRERDDVTTAIRIVDLFSVDSPPADIRERIVPLVHAAICVLIKGKPGRFQHTVGLAIIKTGGEKDYLGELIPVSLDNRPGMEDLPSGSTIAVDMRIGVKNSGTFYLVVELDGDEVQRVPFTVRMQTADTQKS